MRYLMNTITFETTLNNTRGKISGYASVFKIEDSQKDLVAKGAFQKTMRAWRLHESLPKMLWQHKLESPIGKWTLMREDELGLYVEGEINPNIQVGREAIELLNQGALNGLSIGFRTIRSSRSPGGGRVIHDLDLIEVSLVTIPSNSAAKVLKVE